MSSARTAAHLHRLAFSMLRGAAFRPTASVCTANVVTYRDGAAFAARLPGLSVAPIRRQALAAAAPCLCVQRRLCTAQAAQASDAVPAGASDSDSGQQQTHTLSNPASRADVARLQRAWQTFLQRLYDEGLFGDAQAPDSE